jgi:hypothetical protein
MLAAVNKAVAAAKRVLFEFIAKRSISSPRKNAHVQPMTFKSSNLQRFECP